MSEPKLSSWYRRLSRLQESLAKRLFWRQHLIEAKNSLQQFIKDLPNLEMMLCIPYMFRGKGYFQSLGLKQNMLELRGLAQVLSQRQLATVCEIGTFRGGTLFIWCRLAQPDAMLISIDLPGGAFGGGYFAKSIPFFQSFCQPGQSMHCLRGSSHDAGIRDEFQQLMENRKLDFLFIDGDHSYEGVKKDFEFYAPYVKPGGVVGFHDILQREDEPTIQVYRFWNELRTCYRHEEFIDDMPGRRRIGIGLVTLD